MKGSSLLIFFGLLAGGVMSQNNANMSMMLDMVSIPQGQMKGMMMMSRSGRPYYSFMSIPYARPPRRFEPAEPPMNFPGMLDATKPAPMCAQLKGMEVMGQEDCLYLSVHAPQEALRRHRVGAGPFYPVIVFLFGGVFKSGFNDDYSGKYFMDEDVILVTINFRVGALGFLSTGDGEILGNMGLKDQVLALKWVQSNIHFFGGDAGRVTLYGESSGAVAAQLHMLSPMSTGLFSRVIAHSGSALVPWAISKNPAGTAQKFGMQIGCNSTNSRDLGLCLKAKDFKDIVMTEMKMMEWHMDPMVPFPPTVEVVTTPTGFVQPTGITFLPDHPYNMIRQGRFQKVPMITGINKDEGLMYHSETILANEKSLGEMNAEWNRIAPISLIYGDTLPTPMQRDHVSEKIKGFYFGNKMVGPDTRENLTNLYSDRFFVHGVQTAAFNFAHHIPVYPFHFSYQGAMSNLKMVGVDGVKGVAHSDDIQYFFETTSQANIAAGSPDEMFSKKVVKLWVSFAYTGKPVETYISGMEWLPVQPRETVGQVPTHYYDLNMEYRPVESPFTIRMHFWNHLLDTDLHEELLFIPYRNNKTAFAHPPPGPYMFKR